MRSNRYNLVFCYAANDKENDGTEMLYSPLALAYLARHTPHYYDITLYDEYVGEDLDAETVEADLVAISSLTSGITRAYEIADVLKRRGIKSVIGGAHATSLPNEALQHFDTVIQGEGETPWRAFLEDFEANATKSIYFGKMNVSLEKLGAPDRRYIHPNYHYASLLTSRGCPYHCSFCYLTVYKNRKYRAIPHETVLHDLESLRDQFAVIITDENFVGYTEKDYADRKALLHKMISRKFKFYWGCQASVNLAQEPELMDLMYEAGCRVVFMGFEASSDSGLKQVNKKHNLGVDYKQVVKNLHKHKLAVIASTILGLDYHKKGYHLQLIKELKEIKADYVRVFYMTAWPGTPLYKELEKEDRVCTDWEKLRKDIPTIKFKNYTHLEAIEARTAIMDSFFNWKNILKVTSRWLFIDRSLLGIFFKMYFRNKMSERIRNRRAKEKMMSAADGRTMKKPRVPRRLGFRKAVLL